MKYNVYGNKEGGALFSEGVNRAFGLNKIVRTKDDCFLASVQPLNVNPEECGMVIVGTIEGDKTK